jgi:hypothetical protein
MFDTIMGAREIQAKNLADFLVENADGKPIVIHGKAYKPDVPFCIGSYSTLVGYYVEQHGHTVTYVDPLADDKTNCVDKIDGASIILYAHNRNITYGYTGHIAVMSNFYCDIPEGSVIVDPWRTLPKKSNRYDVIHYGNTRTQ